VLVIASVLATASAYGASAIYEHDDHGRLQRVTLSDGSIVVYSYDDSGNRTSAVVTPAVDTTPPGPPTQLTATAVSTTRIDLTWASPSDNIGVTGYRLERCSGSGCSNFVEVATPTSTSYSDTGRAPRTTYGYRVSARDAAGNWSGQSASTSATTQAEAPDTVAPGRPGTPVFSNITMTSATVRWAAATDNVGVTGYQYRINAGNWQTLGNLLSVGLTGLTPATTYMLDVRAQDAAGNVGDISSGSFVTPDAAAPSAPANLAASGLTSFTVHLSWSASTDNVRVAGYRVYRNSVHIATVTTPSYTDGTVAGWITYSYHVIAYDAAGNDSQSSNVLSVTTPDTVAPDAPASLQGSASDATHVNLSWSAPSDRGGSGLAGYQIYRAGAHITTIGSTSYTDSGVSGDTTYAYRIVAYDRAGNTSAPSNTVTITTPAVVPATPQLSMTWLDSSTIQVYWTPPSGPLHHYHLEINGAISTRYPPTTSHILGGNGTWSIRLAACTASNQCSGWSNEIFAQTCDGLCP
jgi:YD repeat-containing protein